MILEATQEQLETVMLTHEAVRHLVQNEWISVALVHPDSGDIEELRRGNWHPVQPWANLPKLPRSRDYYQGQRHNLSPASISAALRAQGAA